MLRLFELKKTKEVEQLIAITKSDLGISGPELAKAHIRLGELLAENIDLDPADTTVVALLRGGIFFAQGIYFNPSTLIDRLPARRAAERGSRHPDMHP